MPVSGEVQGLLRSHDGHPEEIGQWKIAIEQELAEKACNKNEDLGFRDLLHLRIGVLYRSGSERWKLLLAGNLILRKSVIQEILRDIHECRPFWV
ncbi:hypothetical protein AVEN_27367-1 [Araneus ventricosus]|uniref:Uncharacterized protein n=1 Tax=Araneus ventricosus TaxID=182803 RepID=A0A4Y2IR71_ARAVE|nr:hypothetical protein AVEN_27367-1 [Araneus ventricosus]